MPRAAMRCCPLGSIHENITKHTCGGKLGIDSLVAVVVVVVVVVDVVDVVVVVVAVVVVVVVVVVVRTMCNDDVSGDTVTQARN